PQPVTERTLEKLGIAPVEHSLLTKEQWEGLVLERVAFVDLAPARPTGTGAPDAAKKPKA
ncbi:MAG: hypothetical protein L3J72_01175, partial [Thermoplasmata archaeon]|nr:hypothetical protein [Thermoplasmata archaeon]